MLPLDFIPDQLRSSLHHQFELWDSRASDKAKQQLKSWLLNDKHAQDLARVWVASEFISKSSFQQAEAFTDLLMSGLLYQSLSFQQMEQLLIDKYVSITDEKSLDRLLRQFRRDMMWRIIWRDYCRLGSMQETAEDTTHLAEVTIQAALKYHFQQLQPRWGTPLGQISGTPQPLVVLGMGKLGGEELNVSSDIDLIFSYPESGHTEGGRKSVSNQEFFEKLGQKIIGSLNNSTVDGFVFRVDMRLRPYGQSGALVLNFDALEQYYQTQGREWERFAMIKARVVSGSACPNGEAAGQKLMHLLQPFTYRQYLDFSAIESMRAMKAMINREVQRKGKQSDVKLGLGGIREVEFVVQVFQLIRGGRDTRFQERKVLNMLPLLEQEGMLPKAAAEPLMQAYVFLRNTEHAIQGYQDKQTQTLPIDDEDCLRLAWTMGFEHWDAFSVELDRHRLLINHHFQQVISDQESVDSEDCEWQAWIPFWIDELDEPTLAAQLNENGLADSSEMARIILGLRNNRLLTVMQSEGRERLNSLVPKLLYEIYQAQESAKTLQRVMSLIEAVCRRTVYLVLLLENPEALKQLITLCSASPWIAEQLSKHPALLDELLDKRALYHLPKKEELRDELRQHMLRVELDDMEGQMEGLRYFRMAKALHVAACEVTNVLPLMKVSDYLTWLAEVIVEHVLELAWYQMTQKHGYPGYKEGESKPEFVVVGYGKMGGIELGHGSDLDLVFIHNAQPQLSTQSDTEVIRPLDNQTFFTRLGQKIIHVLNTQTFSGKLYEVDMRLRPSGNSGLLVSSLSAFKKYQDREAWTWEHQALIRARVVAGGEQLAQEVNQLRHDILCLERDPVKLIEDVQSMRQKMRDHLGTKSTGSPSKGFFHLKQDAGGIVDIEFMVQFGVLRYAHDFPELTQWTDNIRILGSLQECGVMTVEQRDDLIEDYKSLRSETHRRALQQHDNLVPAEGFIEERSRIQSLWHLWLGDG